MSHGTIPVFRSWRDEEEEAEETWGVANVVEGKFRVWCP